MPLRQCHRSVAAGWFANRPCLDLRHTEAGAAGLNPFRPTSTGVPEGASLPRMPFNFYSSSPRIFAGVLRIIRSSSASLMPAFFRPATSIL